MTKDKAILEIQREIGNKLIDVLEKLELLQKEFPQEVLQAAVHISKALEYIHGEYGMTQKIIDNHTEVGNNKVSGNLN